jgi:hypothetical protein
MGSGAKSYMRKGFLIYEEMHKYFSSYMRSSLVIYDLAPDPSEFPSIRGKFYFLCYQCIRLITIVAVALLQWQQLASFSQQCHTVVDHNSLCHAHQIIKEEKQINKREQLLLCR